MKVILFLVALALNFTLGFTVSAVAGFPPVAGGVCVGAVSVASPLLGVSGLRAGLYAEVWTGEMIKAFRASMESIGWINKIRSYDRYAENDAIHFVHIGGDPAVLINNNTYPIDIENLADFDKVIALDKYQTKATRVTDDEIYAISYDKMSSVIERHHATILDVKVAKALAALAPLSNGAATPVLKTTGANAAEGGRKSIRREDIVRLKKTFDVQKIPLAGRVLVLCSDHVNDLLMNDQKFADQYYNYTSGKISNLYGFELYEYVACPYYTVSTLSKQAYGATPGATERQASVAFYAPRMMKAAGTTKAYLSEAKDNPTTQENLVNFRHYFICLPLKNEAIGAVVSDIV